MSNCKLQLREDNTILNTVRKLLWDLPNMQPGLIFQFRAPQVTNQSATGTPKRRDTIFEYMQAHDHTHFATYTNMFRFLSNVLADEGVTVDANGCFSSDNGLLLLRPDESSGGTTGRMLTKFPQSVRVYTLTTLVVCVLNYVKRLRADPNNGFRKFVPIAMDFINNKSNAIWLLEKRIESEEDCPVCLGRIVVGDLASCTHCDHVFHKGCIDSWLEKSCSCPVCRNDLSVS